LPEQRFHHRHVGAENDLNGPVIEHNRHLVILLVSDWEQFTQTQHDTIGRNSKNSLKESAIRR
jgi:hypothetical protein